jgi:hypothetical protein
VQGEAGAAASRTRADRDVRELHDQRQQGKLDARISRTAAR